MTGSPSPGTPTAQHQAAVTKAPSAGTMSTTTSKFGTVVSGNQTPRPATCNGKQLPTPITATGHKTSFAPNQLPATSQSAPAVHSSSKTALPLTPASPAQATPPANSNSTAESQETAPTNYLTETTEPTLKKQLRASLPTPAPSIAALIRYLNWKHWSLPATACFLKR